MRMRRLQPVIWTKGTFLTPQHLQLQDRFLENLLEFHLDSLAFRPWGFATLQISREALAARSIRHRQRVRAPAGRAALRYPRVRQRPAAQATGRVLRAGSNHRSTFTWPFRNTANGV